MQAQKRAKEGCHCCGHSYRNNDSCDFFFFFAAKETTTGKPGKVFKYLKKLSNINHSRYSEFQINLRTRNNEALIQVRHCCEDVVRISFFKVIRHWNSHPADIVPMIVTSWDKTGLHVPLCANSKGLTLLHRSLRCLKNQLILFLGISSQVFCCQVSHVSMFLCFFSLSYFLLIWSFSLLLLLLLLLPLLVFVLLLVWNRTLNHKKQLPVKIAET